MDIYASDEEKGEDIKRWWRENGSTVIVAVVLGVAILLSGRYWLSQEKMLATSASFLYQQTAQLITEGKAAEAEPIVDELFSSYASTPYAIFAAFEMAKHNVDIGDVEGAKPYLDWVITNGDLSGQINIARLRLGRLLLEQGQFDEALVVIREVKAVEFKSLINELSGDIYISQKKRSEAAIAYTTALGLLEQSDPRGLILKLKLDDVAGLKK